MQNFSIFTHVVNCLNTLCFWYWTVGYRTIRCVLGKISVTGVYEIKLIICIVNCYEHCYVLYQLRFKFINLFLCINYHTLFWTPSIAKGRALNFLNQCCCCVLGISFTHSVIQTRRKSECPQSSPSFEPVNSDSQSTIFKAFKYPESRRKFCRTPAEASDQR